MQATKSMHLHMGEGNHITCCWALTWGRLSFWHLFGLLSDSCVCTLAVLRARHDGLPFFVCLCAVARSLDSRWCAVLEVLCALVWIYCHQGAAQLVIPVFSLHELHASCFHACMHSYEGRGCILTIQLVHSTVAAAT